MAYYGDVSLISAWCELRQDFRSFRVDRILQLAAARRAFLAGTRPPDRCLACPQQGSPRRAERWLEGRKRGMKTSSRRAG